MSKFREIHKKIIKWVSYGFFMLLALLLIITFGVPSITENMTQNQSTLAVVNGESVSRYDFTHFLNTDSRFAERANDINANENMRQYAISQFIRRVLNIQYAEKMGITAPRRRVLSYIKSIPFFRTEEDNTFSSERMDTYLKHFNMSFDQFYDKISEVIVLSELNNLIILGAGTSPDEILLQKTVSSSSVQVEYAFLSDEEIKNRYTDEVSVSDEEGDALLKEYQKDEESELLKSRSSVRTELEREKLGVIKHRMAGELSSSSSLEEALSVLEVEPLMSKSFSIGDPVYADTENSPMLHELYSDQAFYEDCLSTEPGTLAEPVVGRDGLYAYTVRTRNITVPDRGDITDMDKGRALNESFEIMGDLLLDSFYDNSKVERKYREE